MVSSVVGSAIVDFGAFPGLNEVSVPVTGQDDIAADALCEAWVVGVATVDHTVNDHAYASTLMHPVCSAANAGVGFTIYCNSTEKMQGKFNINWVWYNPTIA